MINEVGNAGYDLASVEYLKAKGREVGLAVEVTYDAALIVMFRVLAKTLQVQR